LTWLFPFRGDFVGRRARTHESRHHARTSDARGEHLSRVASIVLSKWTSVSSPSLRFRPECHLRSPAVCTHSIISQNCLIARNSQDGQRQVCAPDRRGDRTT